MKILDNQIHNDIWDWVDKELAFSPNANDTTHGFPYGPPFKIPGNYAVYGIENMSDVQRDNMDYLVHRALCNTVLPGDCLYALDWFHSGFLYNPRTESDAAVWVEYPFIKAGGFYIGIPDYYPDGDYYFFIDEHLEFGYLSHPWRKEVWIFGDKLIEEFEMIYQELGWEKLY